MSAEVSAPALPPPVRVRDFGILDDGAPVRAVAIAAGALSLDVIEWGAVIRDLRIDDGDGPRSVVLGFKSLADYVRHSPYFGAIVGRYANRIRDGRFRLDGREIELSQNENGRHHLHGGALGFGRRPWKIVDAGPAHVELIIVSPNGEEGYPGRVEAVCRYEIRPGGDLSVDLSATTDAPTIVNLAAHSYFNLDGGSDILDHRLEIAAEAYTPVDDDLIPTGEIAAVANTDFDFRAPRPVRGGSGAGKSTYDHNFVLSRNRRSDPAFAARLTGPRTGLALEIRTTEPGLQFYDGSQLGPPIPGLGGRFYGPHAGLCLEPQLFPDTPNNPAFGGAVLRPGHVYRQVTLYRFSPPRPGFALNAPSTSATASQGPVPDVG